MVKGGFRVSGFGFRASGFGVRVSPVGGGGAARRAGVPVDEDRHVWGLARLWLRDSLSVHVQIPVYPGSRKTKQKKVCIFYGEWRDPGFGLRVSCFRFRVSGSGLVVSGPGFGFHPLAEVGLPVAQGYPLTKIVTSPSSLRVIPNL